MYTTPGALAPDVTTTMGNLKSDDTMFLNRTYPRTGVFEQYEISDEDNLLERNGARADRYSLYDSTARNTASLQMEF